MGNVSDLIFCVVPNYTVYVNIFLGVHVNLVQIFMTMFLDLKNKTKPTIHMVNQEIINKVI
jgi:hypothetical protein